jgi:hypothetical protein
LPSTAGLVHNKAMRNPWVQAAVVAAAFAVFLASSGLADTDILPHPGHGLGGRLLRRFAGNNARDANFFLYAMVHVAILGAALPLFLAWLLRTPLLETRRLARILGGSALCLAVGAAVLVVSDMTWGLLSFRNYQPFLKYLFYFFSLGLAVTLYGFYLLPAVVGGLFRRPLSRKLAAVLACLAALYLVEKLEVLPLGMTPPDELVWWGGVVFLARLLAGTPVPALPANIMLFFALSFPTTGEYLTTPWKPMLATFLVSFICLCLFLNTRTTKRFPPPGRPTPKAS